MFTGIVQTQANVLNNEQRDGVVRLVIEVESAYAENLNLGASIAINGCCLTVVRVVQGTCEQTTQIHFDVIDETLKLTNLGQLKQGSQVNYERSVTFGTELGGHIVSGHIHCCAKVEQVVKHQDNCKMLLSVPKKWQKYILYKGFVAINGASLTVGEVNDNGFWLHLIPETLAITNLGVTEEGDMFNIEVDQQTYTIINTVQSYLNQQN